MIKYKDSIAKSIPYLKEQINDSSDKIIRILIDDIKLLLGPEFKTKSNAQIYWGLKATLIREGIVVSKGKSVTGEDLLVMRMATSEDWKMAAKLTAELITGYPIPEWEYIKIIGKTQDDWRKYVIDNFIAED